MTKQEGELMEQELREIRTRLARAEQRFRALCAFAVVVLLAGVTMGAASPSADTADKHVVTAPFLVVNEEHKPLLMVREFQGKSCVYVADGEGHPSVVLSDAKDGGQISVGNHSGRPVVILYANEAGGNVCTTGAANKGRCLLSNGDNGGFLTVTDKQGDAVFSKP